MEDRPYLASFLFTLALHTKQTALYYAPAVFCELLGRTQFKIKRIAGLGAVVLLTTLLIWLPLLHAGAALPALRRATTGVPSRKASSCVTMSSSASCCYLAPFVRIRSNRLHSMDFFHHDTVV